MAYLLLAVHRRHLRRERRFQQPVDFLQRCDDGELIQRFRFPSAIIASMKDEYVAAGFGNQTARSHAIPASVQVQIGLRFMATGAMYRDLADIFCISKSSVQRCVDKFTTFVCGQYDQYVHFPDTAEELAQAAHEFTRVTRFPRVIGAVDGSHITIKCPPGDQERAYVNRHHQHSINVQVVVNAKRIVTDLVVRWPGGTHDAVIWNNSYIRERFAAGEFEGYCLLGDSAYPCEPWLMTPLPDGAVETPQQEDYQQALIGGRHVAECGLGVLKSRDRVIDNSSGILDQSIEQATRIIRAAVILNNRATMANLPVPDWHPEQNVPDPRPAYPDGLDGLQCRARLINTFFRQ